METSISEGEIIEGSVTACLRRDLIMDEYFTLANFLVTRIGPEAEPVSIPFQILFKDEQSDIVNPPRNTFVRAEIDSAYVLARPKHIFMLTNIAFVDRDSLQIVSRIPSPPKFWD